MTDLVEFLRARLDEDVEQVRNWGCDCLVEGFTASDHGVSCQVRVLAEVEAKRRILELKPPNSKFSDYDGGCRSTWEDVLWELAQPYADHPDFDPAWKL